MKLHQFIFGRSGARAVATAIFVAVHFIAIHSANAVSPTLWYNGSYDNRDALQNTTGTYYNINGTPVPYNSYVYDNFIVPVGQRWTINGVFSNNQMNFSATTATWDIRQGITAGNAGTEIAHGDNSATQTAVTPVGGFTYGTPEYLISTTLTSPVILNAGTYFLSVAPDAPAINYHEIGYLETTSGANAVGLPAGNDGNSFITNNFPITNPGAYNYATTITAESGTGTTGPYDYSMGVQGTFALVPEPSVLPLLAGMIGLAACRKRGSALVAGASVSHRGRSL